MHSSLFDFSLAKLCEKPNGKTFVKTPKTKLELDESSRRVKWGKYGISKYIYQKEEDEQMLELILHVVEMNNQTTTEYMKKQSLCKWHTSKTSQNS